MFTLPPPEPIASLTTAYIWDADPYTEEVIWFGTCDDPAVVLKQRDYLLRKLYEVLAELEGGDGAWAAELCRSAIQFLDEGM